MKSVAQVPTKLLSTPRFMLRVGILALVALTTVICGTPADLSAQISNNEPQTVELLNGMRFSGRLGSLAAVGPTPTNLTGDSTQAITLIDEDLREVFVAKYNVANTAPLDRFEEEFAATLDWHAFGKNLSRLWIGFGTTLGRLRANSGTTLGRLWADF